MSCTTENQALQWGGLVAGGDVRGRPSINEIDPS